MARQSRDRQSGKVATQLAAQPDPRAGVERGQRLVEQQQPGVGHLDTRQRHALGLSAESAFGRALNCSARPNRERHSPACCRD